MLCLSETESTDIFDVITKCVQAISPHFKFTVEGIRGLIQLPTHDFFCDSPYSESEFWVNGIIVKAAVEIISRGGY